MRTLASVVLAVLVLVWSTPALGQSASEMSGKAFADSSSNVDQQIVNASKALEEAIKTYATGGESTRGATGAVSSLLIESDTIICASWLMAFDRTMTTLSLQGAFKTDEGAALMGAMQNLKNRVEAACQKVLNNEDPPRNAGPTGDGSTPSGTCPECDALKDAYETAQYRLDRAKFLLERARAETDRAYNAAGTSPERYKEWFTATPQELEAAQDARENDVDRAQKIRDTAHRAYLNCLEACHKRTRKETQVGFFDSRRNQVLVATGAAVVGTVAWVGGSGGGTPTAFVSTPVPTPVVVNPTTPTVVVINPAPPGPPLPSGPPPFLTLVNGVWVADTCLVLNDIGRHEEALRNCAPWLRDPFQMAASGQLRIEHNAPWVVVSGNLDETTGGFRGTGVGPIGSFSNVSSTVVVTFQRSGEAVNAADLQVTLGENGVFPGGRPVSYSIRLRKTR